MESVCNASILGLRVFTFRAVYPGQTALTCPLKKKVKGRVKKEKTKHKAPIVQGRHSNNRLPHAGLAIKIRVMGDAYSSHSASSKTSPGNLQPTSTAK